MVSRTRKHNLKTTQVIGYTLLLGGIGAAVYYLYRVAIGEYGGLPDILKPDSARNGETPSRGDQTQTDTDADADDRNRGNGDGFEPSPNGDGNGTDELDETTREYVGFLDLDEGSKQQWAASWVDEHFQRLLNNEPVYDDSTLGVPDSSEPGVVEAARDREDHKVDAVMDLVYNMPEDAPEEEKLAARELYFMYGETGGGLI